MRHPDVSVAHADASAASDTGGHQLALNEVVSQLTEETAVPAVVHRLARVMPPAMRVNPLSAQASQILILSVSFDPVRRSVVVKQVQVGQT